MPRFSEQYGELCQLLVAARQSKGLTQAEVADRLGKPQSFVSKYERGERRLDVVEFLQVTAVLGIAPLSIISQLQGESPDILERWGITSRDLTQLVEQNPSLRGVLLGYIAELKFEQMWLQSPEIASCFKPDDHDRRRRGDWVIIYRGERFVVEVKSLQSNTVVYKNDRWFGAAQVDASDRRFITLPDGTQLNTTLLLVGEFDVLAISVFAFTEEWRFVFAKNQDLPRSTFRGYTPDQRQYLLASLVEVTWPPIAPFCDDLFDVLNELVEERHQGGVE